jgi:hypothetical protein
VSLDENDSTAVGWEEVIRLVKADMATWPDWVAPHRPPSSTTIQPPPRRHGGRRKSEPAEGQPGLMAIAKPMEDRGSA